MTGTTIGRDDDFDDLTRIETAIGRLQGIGAWPQGARPAPVRDLLDPIKHLDEARVARIGRVIGLASAFNDTVRKEISSMRIGDRYEIILSGFDSIRRDVLSISEQIERGGPSPMKRFANAWGRITRGDVATRFDRLKDVHIDVLGETMEQIEREKVVLAAYEDFRHALEAAAAMARHVHDEARLSLATARADLEDARARLEESRDTRPSDRSRSELSHDERVLDLQRHEAVERIARDVAEDLVIALASSEVVVMRLTASMKAKERVHELSSTFFSTNATVLHALSTSSTGLLENDDVHGSIGELAEGISSFQAGMRGILAEMDGDPEQVAEDGGHASTSRKSKD